jgi:hypothetical protein
MLAGKEKPRSGGAFLLLVDVAAPWRREWNSDGIRAATAMRLGNTLTIPSTTFAPALKRNSDPSRHIACMMTASLRATATQAR